MTAAQYFKAPVCLALTAAMASVACNSETPSSSSSADPPLASFRGTVEAPSTVVLPPLSAALVWNGIAPGANPKRSVARPQVVGTTVPVGGQFPAQFELQVYSSPPATALFSCFQNEPTRAGKMGTAKLVAILAAADPNALTAYDVYGQIRDYVFGFVDADLPAASDCPCGALAAGYHLFKFTPSGDKPGCVPAGDDDPSCRDPWPYVEVPLSTELRLELSQPGTATPPNPATPAP